MNVNVIKIDRTKLNEEISKFYIINNKHPYIICSTETMKLLASDCTVCGTREDIEKFKDNPKIKYYCNCTLLIDDDLNVGNIELR